MRNSKKSDGVLRERCAVKYAWIDAQGKASPQAVSASGYQAWKRGGTPNRKRLADSQMLARIRAIHAELKGAYGSPGRVKEIWWGGGFPRRQGAGRTVDAREQHSWPAQAALQGDDGLEAFAASGAEPAESELHAGCSQPSLDGRSGYNRKRRHSTLGYASPVAFLANWISAQYEKKSAA